MYFLTDFQTFSHKKILHFLQPVKCKTIAVGNFKRPISQNHTSRETALRSYTQIVGSMKECRKCILVILQEKPFYAQNSFVFHCFLTSYFCSKIVISLSWDLV